MIRATLRATCFAAALVITLSPTTARASIEGVLLARVFFQGNCSQDGTVIVTNTSSDEVIIREHVHWSADEPVEVGTQEGYADSRSFRIQLIDAESKGVLFESDSFAVSGDQRQYDVRFSALVDCSSKPYRLVMSDTAMLRRGGPPALVGIGWLLVILGALWFTRRHSNHVGAMLRI